MLIFQPGDGAFGEKLSTEIRSDGCKRYKTLSVLVAYARHSGVARLAPALSDFIAAGGSVSAAVGLDQRQTTIEALELLQKVGASVSVFFDEDASRTYHPKIYLLEGSKKDAWIAVGSNNLTAGGLYLNYEASTILTGNEAQAAAKNVQLQAALGKGGSPHSKVLDLALFTTLINEGYILSEQLVRSTRAAAAGATGKKTVFPRSKKPALPPINTKYKLQPTRKPLPPPGAIVPPPATVLPPPVPVPAASGIWKRLSNWDANPTSSPGQIVIPLKYLNFFPALGTTVNMPGGSKQADCNFDVEYIDDGAAPVTVKGARLILYIPSSTQERKNDELRFTFLDRNIFNKLRARDELQFYSVGNPVTSMKVVRVPTAKSVAPKNYGIIP